MRKILVTLLVLVIGLGSFTLSAQTLTVANGTETSDYVPVYGYYADAYLRSQIIYPASMLSSMNGFPINSIVFYFETPPADPWGATFEVKLSEVTDDIFTQSVFIEDPNAETVYTGLLEATGDIMEVNFDVPYIYTGGNLLLEVVTVNSDYYSDCAYYGISANGASVQGYSYSDVSDIGPYSRHFIPKTTFNYGAQAVCSRPTAFTVENVSATDITISWTNTGNTSSYTYQYMPVTSTDWNVDAVEVTTSNAVAAITGLTPGAGYKFRVNATCSDNVVTDWSYVFNFNMLNIPVTLPYEQDFETNPESISDFALSSNGLNQWFIGSATGVPSDNPSSSVHSLYISRDLGATNSYINTSPSESYAELDMTFAEADIEWHFSFDYKVVGEENWDYFSVYLVDGAVAVPTEGAPDGECLLYRASNVDTWEHFSTILENVSGTSKKIVFYWNNDNTGGNNPAAAVDNISIEGNSCAQPSQFVATNVGTNQVTLDWNEMGNATGWTVSYGPAGYDFGDEEETIVVVTTHPFTIGNLTPATEYDFYVQANCESNWTGPLSLIPSSYLMSTTGSDTLTTCGLLIFDDGGPNENYGSEVESYLVLYPANEGEMMLLTGEVSTESCCDYLRIYDGAGVTGPMVEFKGENQVVNVLSTTGPLTLNFHSDYSLSLAGFQLFAECVNCFPPSNVVASDATLDGVTLSWDGDADSYAIYLDGPTSGYYTVTGNSYTLTGLNSSSLYTVQVRSLCGTDSSILSSAASFATACEAITITLDTPWEENFESYQGEGAQPLVCWETPVTTSSENVSYPNVLCHYAPACHSGVNSIEMKVNSGERNMVVLPEFTNNLHDLRLSFWATSTSVTYGILEVGVLTDIADTSTFELVGVCGEAGLRGPYTATSGAFGNYMGAFSFNNVTASSGRIALRFTCDYNVSTSLSWNLDDFRVELNPNCSSPVKTSVTATNVDGHSATISWVDENANHTAWTVFYKKASDAEWSTFPATNTSVVLSGLDPLTAYQVYVITDCGVTVEDPDATLTISFTTLVACPAPTLVTLASVSSNEAVITWQGTADSYNVEYGLAGFTPGTGISAVASTNSYTVPSLVPNTSYTIYINSDCTSASDSLSTTVSYNFKTTMVPENIPFSTDFSDTTETWVFNKGTCANYWTIGTNNGVGALFVTNNGTTPGYVHQSSSVNAEKLFTVGETERFIISFDAQVGGESTFDFMKVFFAPANVNYMASTGMPPFGQPNYSTYAVNFTDYLAQTGNSAAYKFNLTNGNTVHVEVEMPNPNVNATPTSTAKLVFYWRNDGSSGDQPGAIITNLSITPSACPMPFGLTSSNVTATSADISWTADNGETGWEVEYGLSGFDHGEGTVETVATTPSVTLSGLTTGSSYDVYVRSWCGSSDSSSWVGPITILPGSYFMPATGTNAITTCNMIIFDDGGPLDNYSGFCESYLTIYPENPTSLISIQGTLSTESCCDFLRIFDGANAEAPLLGEYKGQNVTIPELLSTNGPLTLYFSSDVSMNYGGFQLTVACVNTTCEAPTDLTFANISTTTANVTWTPSNSVTEWNLEYKKVSESTWTPVTISGTPSYQLTGLISGTSYNVRVQTNCSEDNQSIWLTGVFNTNCETVVTFPYTEGFENNGNIPACWTQAYVTGALDWAFQNGGTNIGGAHTGSYNAYIYFASSSDNKETRLISPVFDLTNVTEPYVSFWHTQPVWINDQDQLTVYYRTSATAEWQQLVQYTNSLTAWTFDSIALPNPSATYQIAFEGRTSYGYGISLDDITVAEGTGGTVVVADPTVATVAAGNIEQTSATLNATITNPDNVTITAKGFEWKTTAGGNYTQIAGTGMGNSFTANLTGLTSNTSYTFKAFITFNGTTVYGEEMTFTTLEQEPSATTADATGISSYAATLNGSITNPDNVSITAQGFEWKATTGGTYASVNATGATMTYNLTGLTANTGYTFRAFVTTANGTHYGQEKTFTTLNEPAEPCDAPTGLTVTNIQSESITVAWDNAPALRWNVQYNPQGGTATTVTASTNSYTLSNLTPETTYQIRVQAVCEEDNVSAWSAPIAVATLVGINTYLENSVTLYPNPANEYIDIRVEGDVNVTGMEVYDVYGKVIRTVVGANNDSPIRINVSDLSAGMYFVRVTTEQGAVTKRFVKK